MISYHCRPKGYKPYFLPFGVYFLFFSSDFELLFYFGGILVLYSISSFIFVCPSFCLSRFTNLFKFFTISGISSLEIFGHTLKPQPARIMLTTWPTYGLPYGFTPSFKGAISVMQSTQQAIPLPFTTKAHPAVQTIAQSIVHTHVQPHFEDQHPIHHALESSDEEDERYSNINGIKENY